MSTFKVKNCSVFVGSKKVGQIHTNEIELNGGDEPQIGDGVLLGYSDGVTTTSFDATAVVPVAGMDFDFASAVVNKQDLSLSLALVNGKIWQLTMRCLKARFKSDAKTGTLDGTFSFGGGAPKITG